METGTALIDRLERERTLEPGEFVSLIDGRDVAVARHLFARASALRRLRYGDDIFIRGLIEFTNYCRNDCLYCGIRRSNDRAKRYRLSGEDILACCRTGYALGFRTFVLQGGEDPRFTPERIAALVSRIKAAHPDCAITLSVGEQPKEVYRLWRDAGADRYLLRHETANDEHYRALHPRSQTPENRKRCLWDLKELGYQVGCGFMVGAPGQTAAHLAEDLAFIRELEPDMVGLGPFIPHRDTPFRDEPAGSLERTLFMLGLVRLLLPHVLLPATTALATIHPQGRELGIRAGANVCMPNLSPPGAREKYRLYNNKLPDGAAQNLQSLERRLAAIGCRAVIDRGDVRKDGP